MKLKSFLAGLVAVSMVSPGYAQQRDDVERLQVTGSHIKRIDVEGPSPVQIIDRDMLDQTGYNSVSDVLRDITASSFGAQREQAGTNSAGTSSVDLRGLGADRTLVLLDGKRLPTDPVTGVVDLNLIPMAAVERIDVLKDGASATYGSDALGGVVNIITRRDFVGMQVTARTSANKDKGGERTDFSLVAGAAGSRTRALTSFSYRNNNEIFSKDRSWWAQDGLSVFATPANIFPLAHGNATVDGETDMATNAGPLQRVSDCEPGLQDDDGRCQYRFSDTMMQQPSIEQFNMFTRLEYDINADITAYVRLMAIRSEVDWQYAPNAAQYQVFREDNVHDITAPGSFSLPRGQFDALLDGAGITRPNEIRNANNDVIGTVACGGNQDGADGFCDGDSMLIRDRLTALGPRVQEQTTNYVSVQTGLRGYLYDTWDWDVSYDFNRSRRVNMNKTGYALSAGMANVLGPGADQYNPFEISDGDFDVLNEGGVFFQPWNEAQSENHFVEAKMSGELFYLAGRPVSAAFGTSLLNAEYYNQVDAFSEQRGAVLGSAGSSGGGSRTVVSAYTELAMNPIDSLELQLAGRFDSYNDFGRTVNPKFGFRYQANPDLMVRGSVGTGFKAPTLTQLYLAQSDGNPTFRDEVGCERGVPGACNARQYNVLSGGNPDLQEEKSVSYNVGVLYQLAQMTSLGFDFWGIHLKDAVSTNSAFNLNKYTLAEKRGLDVASRGIIMNRAANGELLSMEAVNQNLSSRDLMGLDVTVSHSQHVGVGMLSVKLEHGHLFTYELEAFPGLGEEDILGENGLPKWRNNITLGFVPDVLPSSSVYLIAKTIGSHEKDDPSMGDLDRYTEFDLQINYETPWSGVFTVGVLNLFNSTPPLDDSVPTDPLLRTLYNPYGQSAYVQYTQSF